MAPSGKIITDLLVYCLAIHCHIPLSPPLILTLVQIKLCYMQLKSMSVHMIMRQPRIEIRILFHHVFPSISVSLKHLQRACEPCPKWKIGNTPLATWRCEWNTDWNNNIIWSVFRTITKYVCVLRVWTDVFLIKVYSFSHPLWPWLVCFFFLCQVCRFVYFYCRSATITSSEPRLPCPALWSSQCHCYCTVGVPRVWWRSPSGQLYHQWDQHYDNHLTNQWNHTYSTIQCKTNYRGCCY